MVVSVPASRLPQALDACLLAGAADLVLIDTAPHSGEVALAAAEVADLILESRAAPASSI